MNMPRQWIALLILPLLALTGCSKKSATAAPGLGDLDIWMTDGPGDYEAVNLVIREVAVHFTGVGSDSISGWEVVSSDSISYDLLTLRNGVFTAIGKAMVPAGRYTQIRLKLGGGSTVLVGGVTYPLHVSSGLQSGLKIVTQFDVPTNNVSNVAIEFDASRSIQQTSAGVYTLVPVVKAMPMSAAGAISGTVIPAGMPTSIYAIQSADTLGTTMVEQDGTFKLSVLSAGSYSLAVHPAPGYRDTTLFGVAVTAGINTSVGDIRVRVQ